MSRRAVFLMQRDHQVAVIEIAEKTGDIIDVVEVLSEQRILGARHIDGSFDVLSCANGGLDVVSRQAVPGWNRRWNICTFLMLNCSSSNAAA